MNQNFLVYDIETAASKRGLMYLEDVAPVKIPANLKDPEKIKLKIIENRKKMVDKAALYWWTGKIHTICVQDLTTGSKEKFQDLKSEVNVLVAFLTYLQTKPHHTLIGKNSDTFDSPYLKGRAMHHNIGLVDHLRASKFLTDIDKIFGFKSDQQTTLNNYAFGLGIPAKTSLGCKVQEMYDNKEGELIAEYCDHDVEITAEVLRRYHKPFIGKPVAENKVSVDGLF